MNFKSPIYTLIPAIFIIMHNLFPMEQKGPRSLQEQAFNKLSDFHNLVESMQSLSTMPSFYPESSLEINDFVLHNNLAFCRVIVLNFLASTKLHASILSELSSVEMQRMQPQIFKKWLCVENKIFTAYTNGTLESFDLFTKNKILRHTPDGAFYCIHATSDFLVTSQINSNTIQIWSISDLTTAGSIQTQVPTAHLEINNNLLIGLDTAGDIDLYSWPFGKKLCHLQTGIQGMLVNVSWNEISQAMFVSTTKARYIISLGDMIAADILLHNLSVNQLILLAYILQNSKEIRLEHLTHTTIFQSFPQIFQSIIQYICSDK